MEMKQIKVESVNYFFVKFDSFESNADTITLKGPVCYVFMW